MAFSKIDEMVNARKMTPLTRSNAALHRDAALTRTVRARRWLVAGAAGLTGGLAAFVSATAHGHTLHKGAAVPAPTRTTGSTSPSVKMPPLASPNSLGLQGPVQDPQSSSSGSSGSGSGSSSPSQPQSSSPSPQSQAPAAPAPAPSSGGVVSGGS